jgi:hypothetical protein
VRRQLGWLCVGVVLAGVPATASGGEQPVALRRVKPVGDEMRSLVVEGGRRSAALRAITDELHHTNVIVAIQFRLCDGAAFGLACRT